MTRLAELRRRKGFSQRALAKEAGTSPSTVYQIEVGRHLPNPTTLRKLANALGMSPEELTEAVESPKGPRPLSAEWAIEVPREVFEREIKPVETDRLRKLAAELAGDNFTPTREDLKAKESREQRERRNESLWRAYIVREELRERGEEPIEKGLPALKRFIDALDPA